MPWGWLSTSSPSRSTLRLSTPGLNVRRRSCSNSDSRYKENDEEYADKLERYEPFPRRNVGKNDEQVHGISPKAITDHRGHVRRDDLQQSFNFIEMLFSQASRQPGHCRTKEAECVRRQHRVCKKMLKNHALAIWIVVFCQMTVDVTSVQECDPFF
jgi:hypothetical protein